MRRQGGFTLLEVLVAIAIFALMYVLAQQFFSKMLTARDRLETEAVRLSAQQRTLLLMTQDIEQLIARPTRGRLGDSLPALLGRPHALEFTHLGWANPFSLQHRSRLQRVRYVLYDHQLIRRHWPALDVNVGTRPVDTLLLDKVASLQFRYLTRDEASGRWQWQARWPDAANLQEAALLQPLPKSIEMTIELQNGDLLHRYFRLVANPWVTPI